MKDRFDKINEERQKQMQAARGVQELKSKVPDKIQVPTYATKATKK